MQKLAIQFTTVTLIFLIFAHAGHAQDVVPWHSDVTKARQEAAASGRLVLMHFWAPACIPCLKLDKNVFSNPDFARTVEQEYVPVKINVQEAPTLARNYNVTRWPTDVITTPNGRMLHAMVSPQNINSYKNVLLDVAQAKSNMHPQYHVAAPYNPPGTPADLAAYRREQNAYDDPLDQSRRGFENSGQRGLVKNQYTDSYSSTRLNDTANSYNGRQPAENNLAPNPGAYVHNPTEKTFNDSFAPGSQSSQFQYNQFAQHDDAHLAEPPPPSTRNSPSSNPPTGLDGYCPVTLIEQNKWARGDARWGAIHRGRTYLFVSRDAQQAFLARPDRYSPVLSGIDVVQLRDYGRQLPGKRNHGVVYRDRIYLFSNEQSLAQFWQSPEPYAETANVETQVADRGFQRR